MLSYSILQEWNGTLKKGVLLGLGLEICKVNQEYLEKSKVNQCQKYSSYTASTHTVSDKGNQRDTHIEL